MLNTLFGSHKKEALHRPHFVMSSCGFGKNSGRHIDVRFAGGSQYCIEVEAASTNSNKAEKLI